MTLEQWPTKFSNLVDRLVANGYAVSPARPRSKQPALRNWQQLTPEKLTADLREQLSLRFPDHGVFCHCWGFIGVDIDVKDHHLNATLVALCQRILGPVLVVRIGNAPRQMLFYRTEVPVRTQRLPGFEIRGSGAGVILYGIHPTTNRPYTYEDLTPLDVPVAELPTATPETLQQLIVEVAQLLGHRTNPLLGPTLDRPDVPALLTDGREHFVRDQIWQRYLQGWAGASAISAEVFTQLARHADLTRPHASGAKYDLAFVHSRVLSTLRSAKPIITKGPRPVSETAALTEADKESFRHRVNAAGATGGLRRASVLVSNAMLGSIGIANSSYLSTTTIAHRTGLAVDTVKRARRELRAKGFWIAVDDAGGRAKIAHYLPIIGNADD